MCLLLINGKNIYGKPKLRCHFQYYQQKYKMQGILAEWQLRKVRRIFNRKFLKISPTQFMTPSYLRVKWEKVAFLVCNKRFLFWIITLKLIVKSKASGRPHYGLWMPTKDFQVNIEEYKFNRFLYIGIKGWELNMMML